MRNPLRFIGIIILCTIIIGAVLFKKFVSDPENILYPSSIESEIIGFISEDVKQLNLEKVNLARLNIEVERTRLQTKKAAIPRNDQLWFYGSIAILSSVCAAGILIAAGIYRANVKQASIHTYQIGENTIVVHEKDLSLAAPVAMGLMNAEQLKQMNGGMEKALELYTRMADVQTRQIQALVGKYRPAFEPVQLPHAPALPAPVDVPTFEEMLTQGACRPGRPMIFGYNKQSGAPETGVLHDLYSTIAVGLSGAGKSTYICYLIACSILIERAKVVMLDFHYPAAESLGYMLEGLKNLGYITLISNPATVSDTLRSVEKELDRRLSLPMVTHEPFIFCVDEHERWAVNQTLVDLEIRLVNEGRKVRMYLFITSKSAKADKIGDSALRDNFTTSFVFNTKLHNARTFFKDEEKVKLLKDVTPPGEAVFTNRKDESVIIKTPLATKDDILFVANMLEPIPVDSVVDTTPVNHAVNRRVTLTELSDTAFVNQVSQRLKTGDIIRLAARCGTSKQYISAVLKGRKNLTQKVKTELITLLDEETGTDNVIPFPGRG